VEGEGVGGFEDGEFFALFGGPVALGELTASGHDGASLASTAPGGGDLEGFFGWGVLPALQGAKEGPFGGEVDGGFGVEEFGEAATEGGGRISRSGQR
jgi:hypothetical protein